MVKKVVMLITNEFLSDPRVYRSASVLQSRGHDITVVCLSHEKKFEIVNNIKISRVPEKGLLLKRVMSFFRATKNSKKRKTGRGLELSTRFKSTDVVSKHKKRPTIKDFKLLFVILLRNIKLFFCALKHNADVYHSNDLDTLLAGFLLAKLRGGKLIYDAHELYNEQYSDFSLFLKKSLFLIEKFLIKYADGVITVNGSIASILRKRYNIRFPSVVMNCPPYESCGSALSKNSNGDIKIIYLGGYTIERGLEELILSAKYISGGVLYLRGSGALEPKLHKLVEKNHLKQKVHFLKPVKMTDIVKSLNAFDIGVIPYKPVSLNNQLSTPNKLFEYLMSGLAVAASDMPELRKIIMTNQVGCVFNPLEPRDIAEKLNSMIVTKELSGMKKKALRCAKKTYNWERQSKNLLDIYESFQ